MGHGGGVAVWIITARPLRLCNWARASAHQLVFSLGSGERSAYNQIVPAPLNNGGAMQTRYRLRAPMRAILDQPDGYALTTIPSGALLVRPSPQDKSPTLFGMVGVDWEDRHYSVSTNDLALKAEPVQSA